MENLLDCILKSSCDRVLNRFMHDRDVRAYVLMLQSLASVVLIVVVSLRPVPNALKSGTIAGPTP